MVCMLFSIQDLDQVLDTATGFPFIEIMINSLGLVGGAVLTALFIFNGFGQGISVLTSASRLTWGFARDGGLPWGAYFGHVDRTWLVPARALWLQCGIISLIGVLYLFSETVLTAVISVSTIALNVSYAIPIAVVLAVGRDALPPREFSLSKLGPVANWVSIVYSIITTIFFFFPGSPNPATADMNWAIVIFAATIVLASGYFWAGGRHAYVAPVALVKQE